MFGKAVPADLDPERKPSPEFVRKKDGTRLFPLRGVKQVGAGELELWSYQSEFEI
jgi:hypothetical protein